VTGLPRKAAFLAWLPQVLMSHQRRAPGRELSRNSTRQSGLAHSRRRPTDGEVTKSSASRAMSASTAGTGAAACQLSCQLASIFGAGTGRAAAWLMISRLAGAQAAPSRAAAISSRTASRRRSDPGVLLSRTVGSLLADATSWRVVYLSSAACMAALALVLRRALPARPPAVRLGYGELLRSTARLVRAHPALRRRALYQAAMFGAFSAFWSTVSFVLTSPPFSYSQLGVGLFALIGAGGALIAPTAGRLSDRGLTRPMTAVAFVIATLAFALAGLGRGNVVALAVAGVVIDMAVQSSFIFGQHTIYRLDPGARTRLNSIYIATFFLGGAIGSQAGAIAYHLAGWTAVAVLGGALPTLALLAWMTESAGPAAAVTGAGGRPSAGRGRRPGGFGQIRVGKPVRPRPELEPPGGAPGGAE
jgi:predicted MFS family arabinose efflux permease